MSREPESFIEGRELAGELQTANDQVLAIDVLDPWAAVFQFSLHSDGWFQTDTTLANRTPGGDWEFMTAGGMRGTGWDLPWSRPTDGWPSGHQISHRDRDQSVAARSGRDITLASRGTPSTGTDFSTGDPTR